MDAIHNVLYDMAQIIARTLENHNIRYMIDFGTLLGAIRHGGFIPWDDDFDFLILEDDYDSAMQVIQQDLPEWIVVENQSTDSNYLASWTALVDKNSEAISESDKSHALLKHRGLAIDLFKASKVPLNSVEIISIVNAIDYYDRKRALPNAISEEDYRDKVEFLKSQLVDAKVRADKNNDIEVYTFVSSYKCKHHYISDVFPLKRYKFRDTEFWGPNNADAILTQIYGDWRKLPSPENRKAHYTMVNFKQS